MFFLQSTAFMVRSSIMRPKKSKLNTAKIVSAALELIEKRGLANLSMRTLSARLKVEAMSLYHYFPSRTDILNAVLDQVVLENDWLPADKPWQERLRFAAFEWRRLAVKYPNFYPYLAVHRMNTKVSLNYLNRILEIFKAAGLDREETARYFRTFGYYLMGAGLDEGSGYNRGPSAKKVLSAQEEALEFPLVAEVGEFFAPKQRLKTFELGVELFIASIEKLQQRSN